MKIKILLVMHQLEIGGAERVVTNLVNNFNHQKYEIHLCLFKKKGPLVDEISPYVVIHDLNSKRVLFGVFSFVKLLTKLKPDICFSSISHVNLLISMLIKFFKLYLNTKFIAREVNNPSIRATYLATSKKMDSIYKYLIKNFDGIIAQSKFMKNDLINCYIIKPSRVSVVSNPVDLVTIHERMATYLPLENKFSNGKFNLLAVGGLRYQKGFDLLLNTIYLLNDQYHLFILGNGEQLNNLKSMIIKLKLQKKVTLLGETNNPYRLMKCADLVVSSSRYEGFPNVILEANACGKYVIAFNCPGVDDEIIKNNLNGTLVENENIKLFADAIRIFKGKKTKINQEALIQKTTEKFMIKSITKEYDLIFDDLLREA